MITNPTPGELVDRQTILQIRVDRCGKIDDGSPRKSVENIEQSATRAIDRTVLVDKHAVNIQPAILELEAIQSRLDLDWLRLITPDEGDLYDKLLDELREVNLELWKLEDQARIVCAVPSGRKHEVMEQAFGILKAINTLNDRRREFVRQINAIWRIATEEKIYA